MIIIIKIDAYHISPVKAIVSTNHNHACNTAEVFRKHISADETCHTIGYWVTILRTNHKQLIINMLVSCCQIKECYFSNPDKH